MGVDEGQGGRRLPDGAEPTQEQVQSIAILWEIELAAKQPQPDEARLRPGTIQVTDELSRQQDQDE
jgi:hypothetical protein